MQAVQAVFGILFVVYSILSIPGHYIAHAEYIVYEGFVKWMFFGFIIAEIRAIFWPFEFVFGLFG